MIDKSMTIKEMAESMNMERSVEIEALKDCAYFENRLLILSDNFVSSDIVSVKEYYYELYCNLLDEYKDYLKTCNLPGYVNDFELSRFAMKTSLEYNIDLKLVRN